MSTAADRPQLPWHHGLVAIFGAFVTTAIESLLLVLVLGSYPALFAHRRATLLLAVWLVGAIVLALLKPVRSRTGTRREADLARMLALLAIPLFTPMISLFGEQRHLWMLPGGERLGDFGILLVAAGLTLRIAAMKQLGSRFDPTLAIVPEHALETRGLYSRIRHPGYTGAWLAALGAALTFGSALGLIPVALFAWALAARVRDEERMLETHFGDAFRGWRARTGAFLPR